MRTRTQAPVRDLRLAIDCLPRTTREAMLAGISSNQIIVGAYTDRGGICPMLAAHRAGGRTNLISFARAWDRLASRDARVKVARRATERELLILRTHLEASLLADDGGAGPIDLAEALAEHRELVARGARQPGAGGAERRERDRNERDRPRRQPPGDPERTRELRGRPGWAWLRVFRRYDEYQRALEHLEHLDHLEHVEHSSGRAMLRRRSR
jgi:hypothetical protein